MKTCPGCSFLMSDDQDRCEKCATEAGRFELLDPGPTSETGIEFPDRGGVAVMAPPKVAPLPEAVRYRPARKRLTVSALALIFIGLAVAVAALGWAGHGPLADQFGRWGIVAQRSEAFPEDWRQLTDPSQSFSIEMPIGAGYVYAGVDPAVPTAGLMVGAEVDPGTGSTMTAVFTDFGLGDAGLVAYDSPAGVRELAARFIGLQMTGEQTVVRDAVVPEGFAVDTVVLSDGASSRVRFIFAGDRFYALLTSGPDKFSAELDAAHQRLLGSFDPRT